VVCPPGWPLALSKGFMSRLFWLGSRGLGGSDSSAMKLYRGDEGITETAVKASATLRLRWIRFSSSWASLHLCGK
jgi:hypothetical protein